jgi:hypothetical protein
MVIVSDKKNHPQNMTITNVIPMYKGKAVDKGSFVTTKSQANDASSAAAYADIITGSVTNLKNRSDKVQVATVSVTPVRHFIITWL